MEGLKLPIRDPTINLVPSKELRKCIGTLQLSSTAPASVRCIHTAFNTSKGQKASKPLTQKDGEPDVGLLGAVEFTAKERGMIEQYITDSRHVPESLDGADHLGLDPEEPQEVRQEVPNGNRLKLEDIKWLYSKLKQMRQTDPTVPYLHTLLRGCRMELPENPIQERNPVLEARCQRLRKEQEDREYHRMTKNVDSVRKHMPEETISYQMKQINRHLIAVAQFVFSVAAGFAFGFIGIELIIGQLDFGFRLLLGIIIALVIALAEIYFLAKKLNEEYELPPAPGLVTRETSSTVIKTLPANGISQGSASGKEHTE